MCCCAAAAGTSREVTDRLRQLAGRDMKARPAAAARRSEAVRDAVLLGSRDILLDELLGSP